MSAGEKRTRIRRVALFAGALATIVLGAGLGFVTSPARAQDGMEPLGGQPPAGAQPSVADFDYQIKHQRAFEAMLWSVPAVAIYDFRRAAFDTLGAKTTTSSPIPGRRRRSSRL